jgi:hypothetical protein
LESLPEALAGSALVTALETSSLSEWLRFSRWGYAAINTTHVLGLAVLVGAILPLDLRLVGLWRSVDLLVLARVLVPVAAGGLAVAAAAGLLLFMTRPAEYAGTGLFLIKLLLVAGGTVHALALHYGPGLARTSPAHRRLAGLLSLTFWTGALVCGRLLAFVGD